MKILLIEDDKFYANQIRHTLFREFGYEVVCIGSRKEFASVKDNIEQFDLILYDIFLPDCYACDFVDELIATGIPLMVITASDDEKLFKLYSKKRILDFIIKSDMNEVDYLVIKIKIFNYFKSYKILVLEDTRSHFIYIRNFFRIYYPFATILYASTIKEAKKLLKDEDIRLILVDYILDGENGIDFVKDVRRSYNFSEMGIIALTSSSTPYVIFRFLKSGANGFMTKGFDNLTFITEIDNIAKELILFDEVRNLAYKDYLTKCYNRRYLFEEGKKIFQSLKRSSVVCSIVMLDLDHFKKINDTYGHDIGDLILKDFAQTMLNAIRENDFVVRMGGEEFLIFFGGCDKLAAKRIVEERIQRKIKNKRLHFGNSEIKYDFSAGIAEVKEDLEAAIKEADDKLYKAKKTRGIIVV